MKSRRLLIIFPSNNRGGAEEYALRIARAAKEAGLEVHAGFPNAKGTQSLIEDMQSAGVRYHCLDIDEARWAFLGKGMHALHFLMTLWLLFRLRPKSVLISMPLIRACFGSMLACGFMKVRTLCVMQLVPRVWPMPKWRLRGYRWARRRGQSYVAVSENNRGLIAKTFGMNKKQIPLIRNGASIEVTDDPSAREAILQELGLPAEAKLLLTVSRLHPQKAHHELLPAIPRILEKHPETYFLWIGDGILREELAKRVKEYGVEKHVHFLGHRRDVPRFLQTAELFLFPTNYEGQPFALMEAMAYSLPVIASAVSGIPEIITHRESGLLCPANDSISFLEETLWALEHPAEMKAMAEKARDRVAEFDEAQMVKETLALVCGQNHKEAGLETE